MTKILSNTSKFELISNVTPDFITKILFKIKGKINRFLAKLRNISPINEETYKELQYIFLVVKQAFFMVSLKPTKKTFLKPIFLKHITYI